MGLFSVRDLAVLVVRYGFIRRTWRSAVIYFSRGECKHTDGKPLKLYIELTN